ncbi:hypothetical protein CRG98_027732 [Punica granatum]|uniref:Uncharacterized protein n=1 Tax=Punica granatum TaxID=22663 RepID=A0A2I0J6M3_PUNGR|nr:hypothetical protein CRG98_027732 [Punica granatum]
MVPICRGGTGVESMVCRGDISGGEEDIRTQTDSILGGTRHPDPNQLVTTHEAPRQHLTATWAALTVLFPRVCPVQF